MEFDWWSANIDRSHQFNRCNPLSFMPPAEPKPADPAPAPAPALVGGFAQALSRMAAANKWSICGTSHKDAKEQNGFY